MSLVHNINRFQNAVSHSFHFGELRRGFLFTPFNKVETITEGANNYKIEYYPNQQKAATTLKHNNTVIEHEYYAGKAFEWETVNDKKYYYVYAEGKPIAVFIQEGDGTPVPYLILTDHLGSVDLITDRYGNVVDSMSFDAWGNRRIYNNWQQKDNTVHLIDRGFTMHQHLDSFTLINMEGRMYDPVVAQFLSPDPYVQAPDNTQNLNRYNYCYNSPLMYTDPNGEWIHFVVGAVVGGISNLFINRNNIENGWDVLGYFTIGSIVGAATAGIGAGISSAIAGGGFAAGFIGTSTATSTGFLAGAAIGGTAGTASGFGLGFGNSLMQGNSFSQSLQNGIFEGLKSGTSGALLGGIIGGFDATLRGRDFFSGSYKEYNLELKLLATNNNNVITTDRYTIPDDATVVNLDDHKVYYKPEEGVAGIKDYVSPNKYIKNPVDGVATSKYTNQVFKIPDGGRVKILLGGDVNLTMGAWDRIKLTGYQIIKSNYKYGWMSLNQLDKNWETLFKMAHIIK